MNLHSNRTLAKCNSSGRGRCGRNNGGSGALYKPDARANDLAVEFSENAVLPRPAGEEPPQKTKIGKKLGQKAVMYRHHQ